MSDTSVDFSSAADLEPRLSTEIDAKPFAKPYGYCGECGTWDAHDRRCFHCGYHFDDEPIEV